MEQMINNHLTILSVSYNSAQFLEKNYQLTKAQNTGQSSFSWGWIVVENSPEDSRDKLDVVDNKFQVIPGVEAPDVQNDIKGSYQHGLALNKALKSITSRYLLILDPDFYIVRTNWMNEIIDFVTQNELAFFGVPWHPKHYSKYRYFPSIHCLLIDLQKININKISFVPDILGVPDDQDILHSSTTPRLIFTFNKRIHAIVKKIKILSDIFSFIHNNIKNRLRVGKSRDTGFKFYNQFSNKNIHFTLALPVFKPSQVYNWPMLLIDKFMPEKFSFIPKNKEYFTQIGFKEHGFIDVNAMGYEEFIWKSGIFGFHLRCYATNSYRSKNEHLILLNNILNNILTLKS